MYKCSDMESLYEDMPFCQGKKSLPGVRGYVFGIAKRDVVKWPTLPGAAAKSLTELVNYVGDFVLATDKKWHKIGMIPNNGELKIESQGTYGSKTFKVTSNIVIPGTEEEATGYIAAANNDEMIYLIIQRNGKARMVGSESFTPELSLSQDTGKAATDTNSTNVEAVATDEYPAPFYPGKIETADADISGTTGCVITDDTEKVYTGSDGKNYVLSQLTLVDGVYYVTSSLTNGAVGDTSIKITVK